MTKEQLINALRCTEETLLVELLALDASTIVDAFLDKIEDRLEYLYGQYENKEYEV